MDLEVSTNNYIFRSITNGTKTFTSRKITLIPLIFLISVICIGIVGPYITPYDYDETLYEGETIKQGQPPSVEHPLGTTFRGQDVLSRVLYGARATVTAGLLGGSLIIGVGMLIGVTAGYLGGQVDNVLMRFTDMFYSVPLLPFAIVLIAFLGVGFYQSVVAIGLILWRGNARVLRSQVLQIKERPYVLTAKATGASTPHIIVKHILPNIAPMAALFFALGIGHTIIIQASLSFLGMASPYIPSWGVMVRNAYNSGYLLSQPGWGLVPGILISLTVVSTFLLGREVEAMDDTDAAIAEAG